MTNRTHSRLLTLVSAAGALGLGASLLAGPAAAAEKFDFLNSSYILTLRAGGFESYAKIPRYLPQDYGFSYVDLIHDIGQEQGRCEAFGAGYWLGQEVEEGVLGAGAAPPDAGDVSGGYRNPTTAREVIPNLSPGDNLSNRNPGVKNYFPPGNEVVDIPSSGNGPLWTADCKNDAAGSATGNNFDGGGAKGFGSTASAEVSKETGVYTGTSRAYALGLEGAFDAASSLMQVTNKPGQEPTISYRISYFTDTPDELGGAGNEGVSFGGNDVPASQFVEQFNAASEQFTTASKPVGTFELFSLKPEVLESTDGGRKALTISVGKGTFGFEARNGTIGQEQAGRLAAVTFEGIYQPLS